MLSLLSLFATTLLLIYHAEKNFRTAILEREEDFLRRMLAVAADQVYAELQQKTQILGASFVGRPEFQRAFAAARPEQDNPDLQQVLNDPFVSGYVNAATISLEALKVYDADWRLLAIGRTASLMNVDGFALDPGPSPVVRRAMPRQGTERLRAFGGSWASQRDAYYSVILPVGGLKLRGYLEVVVNSAFNLPQMEGLIGTPLSITNLINGRNIHNNGPARDQLSKFHEVSYRIRALDEEPLYQVQIFADAASFDERMERQQTHSMLISISINLAVLILVLWFLERLLVAPMRRLRNEIHSQTSELTGDPVSTRGLFEFHDLARDFNHLVRIAWQQQLVLEKRSSTDELTQVPNRRALDQFLQAEQNRAARCNDKLSLLMVDIDYFKKYNDHYGHQAGDDCLREVAQALQSALPRATDFVGRYGGEEFTVVLPGTDLEGAVAVAERLLEQVREHRIEHLASEVAKTVTLSIGVAVCQTFEPGCIESLKKRADEALYEAKHQGRNRLCVYQPSV
ncbi:MAG: diguanylate cyclase [Gammaproteobacteria bacterium]|nr:diguanylate cyclase [Gammaproteobacteria bacterium]